MPIAFEQVSFSYNGTEGPWALHDISFALEDGEFFGIAGRTGSGKSTLIQHMNGLLQPTCGRVTLEGGDLADKRISSACRGRVGVAFQYPEHQLFADTVRDDVAFGPKNLGIFGDALEERVAQALAAVDLDIEAVGAVSPFELSGGQQRRVALAGVLAMNPRVLVLDEPAAGLDPQGRRSVLALIEKLHADGLTVVMVSHVMEDLARLATRILVLDDGAISLLGTPAEVFANPAALRDIGLDAPPADRVAERLRQCGFSLPRPLYDAQTLASDIAGQIAQNAATEFI